MALLDVQRALTDLNRTCRIVSTQRKENITVYLIRLEINSYFWTVCHRYSEFYDLNEKLVNNHNLDKSLLPPKKLFGKNSDAFIQKRQNALESYLHGAIAFFLSKDQNIPAVLRDFFDFQKYEVHGVTQTLAESFYHYGDSILAAGSLFTLNPLHLSSITERLKLAVPTYVVESKSKDLGHLLDFASQLVRLRIEGSDATVGTSNLIMNRLLFDLSYFKNIKELQIYNCDMKSLKGVGNMRSTVKKLTIKNSIENLRDLLLCDVIHWPPDDAEKLNSCWTGLEVIQFSFNKLKDMDESITLLVNISEIDLSHNQLTEIKNLETLNKLNCLNLSSNHISSLDSLHTKLGNIRCLNLASNRIASISGLSKLYSLEYLDLSHNIIEDISEIEHLSHLPCLEALKLFKNPVTTVVDYRIKVLVCFAQRINELALDNHATTQKEKDTVAVIHAIKVSKERSNYTEDTSSVEQCDQPSSTQQVSSCNPETEIIQDAENVNKANPEISEFKHQIQLIKSQGGENWLRLLNTMRKIDTNTETVDLNHEDLSSIVYEPIVPNHDVSKEIFSKIARLQGVDDTVVKVSSCVLVCFAAGNCSSQVPVYIIFTSSILLFMAIIKFSKDDDSNLKLFTKIYAKDIRNIFHSFNFFYVNLQVYNDVDKMSSNYYLLLNDATEALDIVQLFKKLYSIHVVVEEAKNLAIFNTELSRHFGMDHRFDSNVLYCQRIGLSDSSLRLRRDSFRWIAITPSHLILCEENFNIPNIASVFPSYINILISISIKADVKNFSMCDSTDDVIFSITESNVESKNIPLFSEFGYYLKFEFESSNSLSIRFPSKETRDKFLNIFTSYRRE